MFVAISTFGQSAESCPPPDPVGDYTCPLGDVPFYSFDLTGGATDSLTGQIEGSSGSTCCGDELNTNAKCNVVEVLLHPQTTSISLEFYGNLGTSGSIKFSTDPNDVCDGTVESLNDFDRDSICVDGVTDMFLITICKPGTADYCLSVKGNTADGFGDQVVLLDDVVNCQYEVNVSSTDTLYNIVWRSLTGNPMDTMFLDCPGPDLDCLTPVFTPPGNLNNDEEYEFEVCGEYYSEDCGPTGIVVCDTVNILIIPQIVVDLDDVTVCVGDLPYEIVADVDPDEPTFEYYWYDDYDGPDGPGNLLAVTNDPEFDASYAGPYSIYVLDTDDASYNCTRTFTYNFDVVEEFDPVADIQIIDFDECNLTVTFSAENSQDNTGADNLDYAWEFGDGAVQFGSSLEVVTHTYDECDRYTVYLYIEDPDVQGDCYWDEIELDFEFDDEDPVLTCPDILSGQCEIDDVPIYQDWDEFINATGAGFTDNCMVNESSFAFLGQTDSGDPDGQPCPMIWERTYYVEDMCGNSTTCVQQVSINDDIPPVVVDAQDELMECVSGDINSALQLWLSVRGYATATDNCTDPGDLVWTYLPANPVIDNGCGTSGSVDVTFYVTDECGNSSSTTATFTVTDNSNPEINCPPDVTLDCPANTDPSNTGFATATDDCDGNPVVTYADVVTPGCGNTFDIERTWTATDDCGFQISCVQNISVVDVTQPTITTQAQDITIQCDLTDQDQQIQDWLNNNGGASATDDCNQIFWSNDYNGIDPTCGGAGSATVTFTVIDECGNTITTTGTATIIDGSAPTVTCTPTSPTFPCDISDNETIADNWNADNINALIACSSDPCGSFDVTSDYDFGNLSDGCGETGTLTVNYFVEDECGNVTTLQGTITFEDDTAPTVTCTPQDETFECNGVDNESRADQWNADNIADLENCSSDACGLISVTSDYNFNNLSDECGLTGSMTVTYTVTDECGNLLTFTATLTIEDNTAPEINCPADVILDCPANIDPSNTGVATGTDDCGTVAITYEDVVTPGCGVTFEIERTWTATDQCGQETSCVQIIAVIDDTPPAVTPAQPLTIQCDLSTQNQQIQDWLNNNGGATATDACNAYAWSNDYSSVDADCGGTGTVDVTFTVVDACGNENSTTATITIIDGSAPIVSCAPTSPTFDCDVDDNETIADQWNDDNIAALIACSFDPCGSFDVSSDYDFGNLSDGCGETGTLTVNYFVEDECGNVTTLQGTITFEDNTAPTVTCTPSDLTIECNGIDNESEADQWNADNIADLENCSDDVCGSVAVTSNYDFNNLTDECGLSGELTVTYTVTDECGNFLTFDATLTIEDNTAPEIICPADVVLQCPDNIDPSNTGTATGTDDCGTVAITYVDVVTPGCGNTFEIERTWTATDQCGMQTSCIQIIEVIDDTPPAITPAQPLTLQCDLSTQDQQIQDWLNNNGGATATDACNNITWSNDYSAIDVDCGGTGTVDVTFTVVDDCGNESSTTATITIIDGSAPTVSCTPTSITYDCDVDDNETLADAWNDDNIAALIACSFDPCGSFDVTSDYDFGNLSDECGETGTLTVNYFVEDECGNVTTLQGTITFEDNSAPVVSCTPTDVTLECNGVDNQSEADQWNADNLADLEGCSSDVCGTITVSSDYNFGNLSDGCGLSGDLTVTYTIVDQCGNPITLQATLTIIDNEPPSIDCPADVTLDCPADTNPTNTGTATGVDDCGTVNITYVDVVTPGCGNTFDIERTWTATDECGLQTTCVQNISVIDVTPPAVTPAQPLTIQCDLTTQDQQIQDWLNNNGGATATDACNAITWSNDYAAIDVDCGGAGSVDVTFTVVDACGNENSTTATITIVDGSSPIVTCTPTTEVYDCDEDDNETIADTWNTNNINALIACSSDPCGSFEVTSDYDFGNLTDECGGTGTMTVNYFVTDDCGNVTTLQGTITFEDNIAPVITCAPTDVTLECNSIDNQSEADQWNADNISALEGCSDDACGLVFVTSDYDFNNLSDGCGVTGTLTVTYTITDECGNAVTLEATLTIEDNVPPTIDCPADVVLECPANIDPSNTGTATGLDDCGAVTITYNDVTTPACGNTYSIERTWTATDECGLQTSCVQIITVEDNTPPSVTPAQDLVIQCDLSTQNQQIQDWLDNQGGSVASDDCNDFTWAHDYNAIDVACGGAGTVLVTFTVTDACGNENSTSANITIVDGSAPIVTCTPTSVTYDCDVDDNETLADAWNTANINALIGCSFDPCGSFEVTSDYDFGNLSDECGQTGTMDVNYFVTDDCGNVTTLTANITFEDNIAPVVTCTPVDITLECDGVDNEGEADQWNADNIAALEACSDDACGLLFVTSDYDFGNLSDGCGVTGDMTVTYTITDECGNFITFEATLLIEDNVPPSIECPEDITLDCPADTDPSNTGVATGEDDCGSVAISYSDVTTPACGNTFSIERTWTATDECGLQTSCVQIITVIDVTPPDVTPAQDLTIECDLSNQDQLIQNWLDSQGGAIATDACNTFTWSHDYTAIDVDCGGAGTVDVTFTVIDECGNTNTTTASIIIIDGSAPVVSCTPTSVVYDCNEDDNQTLADAWNAGNISDLIACSFDPCGTFEVTSDYDFGNLSDECGQTGTMDVNYFVTDDCGNVTTLTATITFEDNIAPVVTCAPVDITLECNGIDNEGEADIWNSDNISALEACSDDACGELFVTSDYDFNNLSDECGSTGELLVTYTITDECGNFVTFEATLIIIDNTPPSIECPADITLECPADTDPSNTGVATGEDDCGSVAITYDDSIEPGCGNAFVITRTWTATDECGLQTSCVQIITVTDETPPEIVCPPDLTIFFNGSCGLDDTPTDLGEPTVTDACGGDVDISFVDDLSNLTECNGTGTFTRTWTAVDECGNIATCDQIITVIDNSNPIVTCPDDVTINLEDECEVDLDPSLFGEPTVTDNCDVDPEITYTDDDSGIDPCNNAGVLIRTWSITDACGNVTECEQTITIVDDTEPTINCPDDITIDCPGDTDPSVTGMAEGFDNCDLQSVTYTDDIDEICPGNSIITRTWTAVDACGNSVSCDQIITIIDETPPTITCPADLTVECDGAGNTGDIQVWLADVSATDNCSDVNITNDFTGVTGPCEGIGEALVTFTAEDECGRTAECQARITIEDTTPPVADEIVDLTLTYLSDIPNVDVEIVLGESDLCDPNPTVTFINETDNGGSGCVGDPLIITRYYLVSDCSDNTFELDHDIYVEADPILALEDVGEILCTGENTGTIDLTISGGTAPYDIDWSSGGGSGQTSVTDLFAGTYTVTITDAIGCELIRDIIVAENEDALDVVLGPENPVICIDGEVVITAFATGGTMPYTYEWNAPITTDETITVSDEGTYSVTVTDANGCVDMAEVELNVLDNPEIFNPGPLEECEQVILPPIEGNDLSGNQAYFTGPGGTGTTYNAGDAIDFSGTMYIYDESGTEPNCVAETEFEITVHPSPLIDPIEDVSTCTSYILPDITGSNLTGNENYYDQGGNVVPVGTEITETTSLFAYDELLDCVSQVDFTVEVVGNPEIDPIDDVTACASYALPSITGVGTNGAGYFTGADGSGTAYSAGDVITTSTVLYMYVDANGCMDEEMFEITIVPSPVIDPIEDATSCDIFTLPEITGTDLTGNEQFFDGPDGTGNSYLPGDEISSTITLYAYDIVLDCPSEVSFTIEIVGTPEIDPQGPIEACDAFTLQPITGVGVSGASYFTEPDGQGTQYSAGDLITGSSILYMYINAGECSDEEPIDITIIPSPAIDPIPGATNCDGYILPEITGTDLSSNVSYFDGPGGSGNSYRPGDVITTTTTIYAYDETNGCFDEEEFLVEIVETPEIDPQPDVEECDSYVLENITGTGTAGASYFTEPNGQGTQYNAGDVITESQTLYMYVDAGDCSTEESFEIEILLTPEIDPIGDFTSCDGFILPEITGTNLTTGVAYFDGPGGTGSMFQPGAEITQTTTLYIYDVIGSCEDEVIFDVEIVETPLIDPLEDVSLCDGYVLPAITGVGVNSAAYYTEPNGQGIQYNEGDIISENTILYMYISAGECEDEEMFSIEVFITPDLDPISGITECDEITLPEITGENLSGSESYYTATNGGGDTYSAGDIISESITLYIYDVVGQCSDEEMLEIEIVETPDIEPIDDITICDVYVLPEIEGVGVSGAAYFTGPDGAGDQYEAGDDITESLTLYIYVSAGDCGDQEDFSVTILETPTLDPKENIETCDAYLLPEIQGENLSGNQGYFTESGGNGVQYEEGDLIESSISLFIYDASGVCNDEVAFDISIIETPEINPLDDVEVCDAFILPEITGTGVSAARYHTAPDGQGDVYDAGAEITESTTLYMYISAGECLDEEVFEVVILETPDIEDLPDVSSCDAFELPNITGTNLSGDEAYFEGPGGTGTVYLPGDFITENITLYIYDASGFCFDEEEFTIEIIETPEIDEVDDVVSCDRYVLPEITGVGIEGAGYFSEPGGQGSTYVAGDEITSSQDIYIYLSLGDCGDEESFNVEILLTPDIDPIPDAGNCDAYILPEITGTNLSGNEGYFTEPGGNGTVYGEGDEITSSVTLYIYDEQGSCFDEESFDVDIIETPIIDPKADVEVCDGYVLPEITGVGVSSAGYFTQPDGQGVQLAVGDIVNESGTYYMYVSAGECLAQESFDVTILLTPELEPIADVSNCDGFELQSIQGENLSGNERYYDQPGGTGNEFFPGEIINTSITLYVFDANGLCSDEETFSISIIETPIIDPLEDVSTCDSYSLPEITGEGVDNAQFFTGPQGTGDVFDSGTEIMESMTLYIYVNAGDCSAEEVFDVTIELTPRLDNPGDQFVCDAYTLGPITGENLSGDEAYYTGPAGTGSVLSVGEIIEPGTTIYIYDGIGACEDEEVFQVIGQDVPEAELTGGGRICSDLGETQTLTLNFSNGNNWIVDVFKDGELYESVNTDQNPYLIVVTEAGEYTIGDVSNASGCSSEGQGSATVEVFRSPSVQNIVSECNALEPGYRVSFEISGGDPFNYIINGETVNNPTGEEPYYFTSETIESGVAYSFEVTDINGCELILVEDAGEDCGCITQVGIMNSDLIELCGDDLIASGVYDDATQMFDFDDALMFVLHEGNDTVLVNILGQSLEANFTFDPSTMNIGQTYYISAVVGNDLGNGFVDLEDECLAVAIGQPVVWYEIPTATIGGEYDLCLGEETNIEIQLTGEAPWSFQLQVNDDVFDFQDVTTSTFTLILDVTEDVAITILNVQDAHCEGEVAGEAIVRVFDVEVAEVVEYTEICNIDFKGSVIDLDTLIISGYAEGVWTDISNSGAVFDGNLVDFHGVEPGDYQFEYTIDNTEGLCEANVYLLNITVLECSCPEISIGEAGPFCNNEGSFDLSSIENESDEGTWSISESPTGSNPATLIGSIFEILDADAGTYGLTFSLNEIDPLCTADTTIYIEIMDQLRAGTPLPMLEVCQYEELTLDLHSLLEGEDLGGQWTVESGSPGNAFKANQAELDISDLAPGTYTFTYEVDSDAPCSDEEATVSVQIFPLPIADAGDGFELNCDMQEGRLDGTNSVGTQFNWTTEQGSIVNGANTATPLVDQPGWYYLEMIDAESGCGTIDSVLVTIDPGFPNADAGPDPTINCAQFEVTIDATNSSEGDYVYTWIGPDGNEFTPPNIFLFDVTEPGSYVFIIEDVDNECLNIDTVWVEGQVNYPYVEIAQPQILNCINDQVLLDASNSTSNENIVYEWWSPQGNALIGDATSNNIMVDLPGLYVIEVLDTVNFCSTLDTVEVLMDREFPIAEAGSGFTIDCIVTEVNLDGNASSSGPQFELTWTTEDGNIVSGSNSPSPKVDAIGMYYLEVVNRVNGCVSYDSVYVDDDIVPIVDFDLEQINPCFGDNEGLIAVTNVEGGVGPFEYSLNNGEFAEESVWDNLRAGDYTITVKGSNGCDLSQSITITEGIDLQIYAGEDQTIILGDTTQLQAEVNIEDALIESVIWSPADANLGCIECLDPLVWPFQTTQYTATLIDIYGCTVSSTVRIFVDRRSRVYAPNIFSPNGDDENDFFTLYSGNQVDIIDELRIFNRWGEKVFENDNFPPGENEFGWDGTFKGQEVNPGVFAWFARVTLVDGTERVLKGDVTLIK